jgi:hypothetical protein
VRFLNRNPPSLDCDGGAEPKIVRSRLLGEVTLGSVVSFV